MGWTLSWWEYLTVHTAKDETTNGFRIHGPRAGKTTSSEGKKAATAAANSIFQRWWWRWYLCIRSKRGLEGFPQLSSPLLWGWRALWCYIEGDKDHPRSLCLTIWRLTYKCVGDGNEFVQGYGSNRIPVWAEAFLDKLLDFLSFTKVTTKM